jgi:acyl-CoA reductase-like NAD-dependent aldehyde dehydrogenase
VVTAAALAERAGAIAEGLTVAVTGAAGQLCTKPGIVFVPQGEAGDAFVADVAGRLAASAPQPMLNANLREGLSGRLAEVAAEAEALVAGTAHGPGFAFSAAAFRTTAADLRAKPQLAEECFGPAVIFATYGDDLAETIDGLGGQLAASIHAAPEEAAGLSALLRERVGRLVFDGFSTGVAVCHAMQHGGPYPATTASGTTSVGMPAIRRFQRPVAWQDAPAPALPEALRDGNPRALWRRVNGQLTQS